MLTKIATNCILAPVLRKVMDVRMRILSVMLFAFVMEAFNPVRAGTVLGTVTSAPSGQPVATANVDLVRWNGLFYQTLATTTADSQGVYSISNAHVGEALVFATAPGFLLGTLVFQMPAGNASVTANISVLSPAQISGIVIDSATQLPVGGARVKLHSPATGVRELWAAADGSYRFPDLPPETYSVCIQDGTDAYIDQCWNDVIPNSLFHATNFAPVNLSVGEHIQSIDFRLRPGATISGVVLNARSGLPINLPQIGIQYRTSATNYREVLLPLSVDGRYQLRGMAPGLYKILARVEFPPYTPQLYPNIECFGGSCDFPVGQFIAIDSGLGGRTDVDFNLTPAGRVLGRVLTQSSGAPMANAQVELWRRFQPFGNVFQVLTAATDAAGNYVLDHLQPLNEYIVAVRAPGYISKRWPGDPCFTNCTTSATAVPALGLNQVLDIGSISLDRGVVWKGQARLPGLSAESFSVVAYDSLGQNLGQIQADSFGRYEFPAWFPGTYFALAAGGGQCQIFQWLPCSTPTNSGTPIELVTPAAPIVIDFDLFIDEILASRFE